MFICYTNTEPPYKTRSLFLNYEIEDLFKDHPARIGPYVNLSLWKPCSEDTSIQELKKKLSFPNGYCVKCAVESGWIQYKQKIFYPCSFEVHRDHNLQMQQIYGLVEQVLGKQDTNSYY